MNKCTERLYNGMMKENPTFVLMLGMCPTLAVTTSAINGIGMGLVNNSRTCIVKHVDFTCYVNVIPDSVTYAGIHRSRSIFRNNCTVPYSGICSSSV